MAIRVAYDQKFGRKLIARPRANKSIEFPSKCTQVDQLDDDSVIYGRGLLYLFRLTEFTLRHTASVQALTVVPSWARF